MTTHNLSPQYLYAIAENFWYDCMNEDERKDLFPFEMWFEILVPDQIFYFLEMGRELKKVSDEKAEKVYNDMRRFHAGVQAKMDAMKLKEFETQTNPKDQIK